MSWDALAQHGTRGDVTDTTADRQRFWRSPNGFRTVLQTLLQNLPTDEIFPYYKSIT